MTYAAGVAAWKLTVRVGPDVEHISYEGLDEAVAAMRARALEIRAGGPMKPVAGFKDYEARDLVQARLQLSGGRFMRKQVAGVDVRGNGEFVPYSGGVRREELDPTGHETPFDAVRETLGQR